MTDNAQKDTGLRNPFNEYVCPIEGDMSRADVVSLVQLCRGKNVIEFGLGGSTKILRQVAKSVKTYETKKVWAERQDLDNIVFIEELHDGSSVKGLSEPCDVIFIDGWAAMRNHFLMEFWADVKECAILHDSRMTYASRCIEIFLQAYQKPPQNKFDYNPYLGTLQKIEWNYMNSNNAVLYKRPYELIWEDWKKTEAGNNRKGYGAING